MVAEVQVMTHGRSRRVSRTLFMTGLVAVVLGTVDPLEGSIAILGGFGLIALAASLRHSRHRRGLAWSVALVAVGVAVMFVLSAFGGVGGSSGQSAWWALAILPYPVGWLLGLVESFRLAHEHPAT